MLFILYLRTPLLLSILVIGVTKEARIGQVAHIFVSTKYAEAYTALVEDEGVRKRAWERILEEHAACMDAATDYRKR